MMGQTDEIAPLDRRLYALRDATATVPCIPLIAASIMGKKLAEGIQGLVLDVKTGTAAFLSDVEESRELARTMMRLGERHGVRTTALLTDMNTPLGRAVGHGLETAEALRCLGGDGPEDLAELTSALVGEMLYLGGLEETPGAGRERAQSALSQGLGVERMARLVELQGGDPSVVEDPGRIPTAPHVEVVTADAVGLVEEISPLALGYGVMELGGGRRRMGDPVDLRVGFVLGVQVGDPVDAGMPLGEVHAADLAGLSRGRDILRRAVTIGPTPPEPGLGSRVLERLAFS